MDLGAAVFYGVAVATIVSALGVVITRSVVYSALLLVLTLALTGLVYLLLLSDFLALVQILVYGGTVSILLLFALMLTRPREAPALNHRGWPMAAAGSVVTVLVLGYAALGTDWSRLPAATPFAALSAPAGSTSRTTTTASSSTTRPAVAAPLTRVGPEQLGTALFTVWAVPFEIASVVLLVALIGSLLVARATDASDPEDTQAVAMVGERELL
jgi:NADH:ubiquinone oxidoreductase subunit 6 (subunit J)